MHARLLHAVDGADGAGQLALQRAQVIDVLHEARGAERVRLVENLVADAAALGQPALGELHAQARNLLPRHHDDGAVALDVVGNALTLEILDDRRGVLDRKIGEQRRHCGAVARTIRKAKNAISAMVTAPIAIIRVAPRVLKNETKAGTGFL